MFEDRNEFNTAMAKMEEAENRMDFLSERLLVARQEHDEAEAAWQAAREDVIRFQPTTAAGAVALLRAIRAEMDSLDRELLAEAIGRCVELLDRELSAKIL